MKLKHTCRLLLGRGEVSKLIGSMLDESRPPFMIVATSFVNETNLSIVDAFEELCNRCPIASAII